MSTDVHGRTRKACMCSERRLVHHKHTIYTIYWLSFITMLRFKFTFLLTFDIPPLPPRSQQFSFGEICSQKDCKKLEKMRSQDAKKTIFITWLWSWQADVRQCVHAQGGENWVGLLMNKIRSEWVYWKSRERCKKCKQGLCSCHKLHLRRRIRFLRRNIAGASHKYTHTQYWEFDAAKPPECIAFAVLWKKMEL